MGVILEAAGQSWPPFVLVAGLLLIGAVAADDGLFAALGARIERIGGGPVLLLAALLLLEAGITAILNLDTAVVFMTPILLHAARRRDCDERPFLYGALFMANGASLLLPGSNLTNLIVLAHEHLSGATFARDMLAPWSAVVLLTITFVALVYRPRHEGEATELVPPLRVGVGVVATVIATALILVLHDPSLPVLAVGVGAAAITRVRARLDAPVLTGLFVLAVALGTVARLWNGPAALVGRLGGVAVAALGAGASVVMNNLPASALLAAQKPPHPLPLLIGLNLGPNLACTGSLSAFLWYRAASSTGARPSLKTVSLLGAVLVPVTITGALLALAIVDPNAL